MRKRAALLVLVVALVTFADRDGTLQSVIASIKKAAASFYVSAAPLVLLAAAVSEA